MLRRTALAVTAGAVTNAVLKAWGGADPTATPQLRETLKCTFTALVELGLPITEAANLLDLTDATGLRAYAARTVKNPIARQFLRMLDELRIPERDAKIGSAMRRLNEFLLPDRVRLIFSNPDVAIDWRQVMDDGEFVILDLSFDQGNLSEDEAQVIGAMILAEIFLACLGRPEPSIPFFVYIDECHRYLTEDIAKLFSEGRKFSCSPILIHQTMGQLHKAGDYISSLVMSASTKAIFRIAEDDDATYLARNVFRGQFDLSRDKVRFRKPTTVGYVPEWLLNESDSAGTAVATGSTTSHGASQSTSQSTTKNESRTRSESDTVSESDTLSESDTVSGSHTDSESDAVSESHTESENESASDSYSQSSSAGQSSSRDYGERYDYDDFMPREYSRSRSDGSSSTDSESDTHGTTSSRGSADTHGTSSTRGSADTYGTAHNTGQAHTTGTAHTSGTAVTEGTAETHGTSTGTNWSHGTSSTTTASQQHTQGRGQTLRAELKIMPTQPYSLDELVYLANVRLGQLQRGQCIVKIGIRPSVSMQTVHVKDGWARPEHVERVIDALAAATPYVASVEEAVESQRQRQRRLAMRIAETPADAADDSEEPVTAPPPKVPTWG